MKSIINKTLECTKHYYGTTQYIKGTILSIKDSKYTHNKKDIKLSDGSTITLYESSINILLQKRFLSYDLMDGSLEYKLS